MRIVAVEAAAAGVPPISKRYIDGETPPGDVRYGRNNDGNATQNENKPRTEWKHWSSTNVSVLLYPNPDVE